MLLLFVVLGCLLGQINPVNIKFAIIRYTVGLKRKALITSKLMSVYETEQRTSDKPLNKFYLMSNKSLDLRWKFIKMTYRNCMLCSESFPPSFVVYNI